MMCACVNLTFYTFRLLPCLNHPANCKIDCLKAWYTCCSGSYDERKKGNCKDADLYAKCLNEENVCYGKCGADSKASTKVTTDFDVEIEGPIVEEA